jgi:hypothetical protein
MAIVVLPRIEEENPFGQLAEVISEQALPYLIQLYANKDKIARNSDTELTDFVEVLQKHAPELVVDGKINWEKVKEWASSDDKLKQDVANYLLEAKKTREEFANSPIIAKLQMLDVVGSLNPQSLNKIFTVGKTLNKFYEVVEKSNLPTEWKLLLISNAEKLANRPDLVEKLGRILSVEGATTTQLPNQTQNTEENTGGWQLSLDGQKQFGIKLEEPQLTIPQISPPQVPKAAGQRVVKQGGGENVKQKVEVKQTQKNEQPQPPTQGEQALPKQSTDEITLPSEVPYLGDVKKLFTNEELLGAGAGILATLGGLALTRNPKASIQTPLVLASLKESGKKAGVKVVSGAKQIPDKVKKIANTLPITDIINALLKKQPNQPPAPPQKRRGRKRKQ